MTTADHAVLLNCGGRFTLHVQIDDRVHKYDPLVISDEEWPMLAAVREIRALGYRVEGDGSWRVGAWTGPGADRAWARIAPADSACMHRWDAANLACDVDAGHEGPHQRDGVKWLDDATGTVYAVTSEAVAG